MCGFVVVYRPAGVQIPKLEKALQAIQHRGPDANHIWLNQEGIIGFGHNRLSIVGLDNGQQPLFSEDGSVVAVVNGEFYDYQKIRQDLMEKGHHFQTNSDSEILIHLYEEFGTNCLVHLRGEFAFVLYDFHKKQFFAARDRFGIKPIFYHRNSNELYFSSEAKSLFDLGVIPEWDEESIYESISWNFLPDRSLFKNISQIPPGFFLIANADNHILRKYWDFNFIKVNELKNQIPFDEAVILLREKLVDSIRVRANADVPVGSYLSGGLDSSLVMGILSTFVKDLNTYTIAFENSDYNELKIAEESAKKMKVNFLYVLVKSQDFVDHFERMIFHSETINNNANSVALYLLSQKVRESGVKVVLTGTGSDEIFGGYPHFIRDNLLHSQGKNEDLKTKYAEILKNHIGVSAGFLGGTEGELAERNEIINLLGFMPNWMHIQLGMIDAFKKLFNQEFVYRWQGKFPYLKMLDRMNIREQLENVSPVHKSIYTWAKSFLPGYELNLIGDRMEMSHSIEGRVPFLDHLLVEYVTKLPPEYLVKISDDQKFIIDKYILREAGKPFLTETVYRAKKHPLLSPPSTLAGNEKFFIYLNDTIRSQVKNIPFLNSKEVLHLLDNFPKEDNNLIKLDLILMKILSLCVLQKVFSL